MRRGFEPNISNFGSDKYTKISRLYPGVIPMSTGRSVEAVEKTAEIYKKYIVNVKSYESKSTPRQ